MRNPNIPSLPEGRWNSEQDAGWKREARRWNLAASGLGYLAALRSTDRSPKPRFTTTQRPPINRLGGFVLDVYSVIPIFQGLLLICSSSSELYCVANLPFELMQSPDFRANE